MKIKVVTFNLRMESESDGKNYFFNRAPLILEKIRAEKPDIIGFQEATERIYEWLKANLYEYSLFGTGRNSDFTGEACPVAFRKERFELYSLDQFWLSPTPRTPGSRYQQQSKCPRVCTVCRIREKSSAEIVSFYNTHLDHIGEQARLLGMNQILSRIASDSGEFPCPVVLTGDMNADPDEISMRKAADTACGRNGATLTDTTAAVPLSFHGYTEDGITPYSQKIDYIFTDVKNGDSELKIWDDCRDGVFLSDHFPISVTIDTSGAPGDMCTDCA